MTFKEEHFSQMYFHAFSHSVLEEMPGYDLLIIPDELPAPIADRFVRYHLYMYDKGSPFPDRIRDVGKRQMEVGKFIGLSDDPIYKSWFEEMRQLRVQGQRALIMSILKAQNDHIWNDLVINESLHYQIISSTLDNTSEEDMAADKLADTLRKRSDLLDRSADITDRIESYYNRLFATVDDREKKTILKVSPETIHLLRKHRQ